MRDYAKLMNQKIKLLENCSRHLEFIGVLIDVSRIFGQYIVQIGSTTHNAYHNSVLMYVIAELQRQCSDMFYQDEFILLKITIIQPTKFPTPAT